jgi:site-specific recombinase XerD
MTDTLLGPWIRRFLVEHLVVERNLSRNTQTSYRDTLCLLLPFVARLAKKRTDQLRVEDITAERVSAFLRNLQETRNSGPATLNQRLAAIHSLSHFISLHCPELVQWCGEIRAIQGKKAPRQSLSYFEKDEMDALLAAPDRSSDQGRRDHVVLMFLYNTGARADEVAHVRIGDLDLGAMPDRDPSSVVIHGKGNKQRRCPLWPTTVQALHPLVADRLPSDHVFRNRRGQPLTRFGIHALVERHAKAVAKNRPSMSKKQLSPHTIRHTTATHLLRAGVDINTIRAWLGHVSLATTNIYAEVDLQMKERALATCEVVENRSNKRNRRYREDKELMEFLRKL